MRIRKKKWVDDELAKCEFMIHNPIEYKGKWRTLFQNDNPLYLELGCGKGGFVSQFAINNENINIIAIDVVPMMLGMAQRKIRENFKMRLNTKKIDNVKIALYNIERISEIFDKNDRIERLYINFCNPWPRSKHKKRRLTHSRQLEQYKMFLDKQAEIYFKTDDDELFNESLEYFKSSGFEVLEFTYDLYSLNNEKLKFNIMTEHEKMFLDQGVKIKFAKIRKIGDGPFLIDKKEGLLEWENCDTVKDVLKKRFNLSKRLILNLKRENKIFVNNVSRYVNYKINNGDVIRIDLSVNEDATNIISTKMSLKIIYEDEYLILLNKDSKIETHPTIKNNVTTLSNGLKYYFDSINLNVKIRPVNRLDKDTSGIIIFAKNKYIQEELIKQMKTNDFKKEYIALVEGILVDDKGEIEAKIARKSNSIIERCIDNENGKYAKTYYTVLDRFFEKDMTLVKLRLETGRTHQIRVHMAYIGHPLVGDFLYGKKSKIISRQALHSFSLEFFHPIFRKKMYFEAELPKDMEKIKKWRRIKKYEG